MIPTLGLAPNVRSAHPQDGPHADVRVTLTGEDVRMTIGLNLPFVNSAAPTARELMDVVDVSEEAAVFRAIEAYFRREHAAEIDGVEVPPIVESVSIERLDESLMSLFPTTGRSALTRFNVIVRFPLTREPSEVRLRWGHFPGDTLSRLLEGAVELPPMLITAQFAAEGRITILEFSESSPWATWLASGVEPEDVLLPVPAVMPPRGLALSGWTVGVLVVAGLGGGVMLVLRRALLAAVLLAVGTGAAVAVQLVAPPGEASYDAAQVLRAFEPLHANVYRAFDYTAEDDIYDALAQSVSGDLLRELYGQIRTGLVQAENDGAIGRVTDVELGRLEVLGQDQGGGVSSASARVRAAWEVEGTVYHFGHSHAKRRAFEAIFALAPVDGRWRLIGVEPLSVIDLDALPTEL
ncbi:MAG: hypothetical protein AAGH71_06105 [Planctomycetota bacterium]